MSTAFWIGGLLVLVLIGYMIYNYRKINKMPAVADSKKVKILDQKNFYHQIAKGISLVDFWAPWCMPCKMMAPVLNEMAEELGDNAAICKVNVDEQKQLAAKYKIRSIPTLVLFKNGKEVKRFVGAKPKDHLMNRILSA